METRKRNATEKKSGVALGKESKEVQSKIDITQGNSALMDSKSGIQLSQRSSGSLDLSDASLDYLSSPPSHEADKETYWTRRLLWLPKGTKTGDIGPWIQRYPGETDEILTERLAAKVPDHASRSVAEEGVWMTVDQTKSGRLTFMKQNPHILPPHPAGHSHHRAMLHVFASVKEGTLLRVQVVKGPLIELARGAKSGIAGCYWHTVEPVEFGTKGFEYFVIVYSPPSSNLFSNVLSLANLNTKHSTVRTVTSTACDRDRLIHEFNWSVRGDERMTRESCLEALITTHGENVNAVVASFLKIHRDVDYTATVVKILRQPPNVQQLSLCLQVCHSGKATGFVVRAALADALNVINPPAHGLKGTSKLALKALLDTAPASDPTWIAALRWGVNGWPREPLPPGTTEDVSSESVYITSVELYSASVKVLRLDDLVTLLCKLLKAVPHLKALELILSIDWPNKVVLCPPASNTVVGSGTCTSHVVYHKISTHQIIHAFCFAFRILIVIQKYVKDKPAASFNISNVIQEANH